MIDSVAIEEIFSLNPNTDELVRQAIYFDVTQIGKEIQWGSEYRTSLVFEWAKVV